MATWENTAVFLRSVTETIKGSSSLNLANYDNGISFENPKISAYGCAISTKNDKRTYSNTITKASDKVYNIKTKSKIIKPTTVTNYSLGSYSKTGDLRYVRGNIHMSGVLAGATGATFVGSYGYNFRINISPFGTFALRVDEPFDIGRVSVTGTPSGTVSSFATHVIGSFHDYDCATVFNLCIEFYYPSTSSISISKGTASLRGYGAMGPSASRYIRLKDFSCKLTSLVYEDVSQVTEADADTLVLVTEEM